MIVEIAFPWAGETLVRRREIRCDFFDLIAAYCRVQKRFQQRMAELAAAEARE